MRAPIRTVAIVLTTAAAVFVGVAVPALTGARTGSRALAAPRLRPAASRIGPVVRQLMPLPASAADRHGIPVNPIAGTSCPVSASAGSVCARKACALPVARAAVTSTSLVDQTVLGVAVVQAERPAGSAQAEAAGAARSLALLGACRRPAPAHTELVGRG